MIIEVRLFGMSAEVERCPFVNTFRARHIDAILLSRSMSYWKYSFFCFSHKILYLISDFFFCIQGNIFLSLVCLSLPLFP